MATRTSVCRPPPPTAVCRLLHIPNQLARALVAYDESPGLVWAPQKCMCVSCVCGCMCLFCLGASARLWAALACRGGVGGVLQTYIQARKPLRCSVEAPIFIKPGLHALLNLPNAPMSVYSNQAPHACCVLALAHAQVRITHKHNLDPKPLRIPRLCAICSSGISSLRLGSDGAQLGARDCMQCYRMH